jgi:hypothetical protein
VFVVAPYGVLVVPAALFHKNPDTAFIVGLVLLAAVTVAVVETAARLLLRTRNDSRRIPSFSTAFDYPRSFAVARWVAVASIVADVSAAHFGRGTIFTQVTGEVAASPVAHAAALIAGWKYVAVALMLYAVVAGCIRVAAFYRWVCALIAAQLYIFSLTATSAQLMAYLTFVAATGAIAGVIRARYVVIAIAVLVLAWPALFTFRNELRTASGVPVASDISATERLRVDRQMSQLSEYDVPADVGQPGVSDLIRYGFVPRILDSGRPAISTGGKINQYLGGAATSSYTFLELGNVYFLSGPFGVIVFYAGWSAAAVLLRSGRPGPPRTCLLCFVIAGPLAWSSMYPDSMIGTVQHAVSAVPVFVVLMATGRQPSRSAVDFGAGSLRAGERVR